MIGLYIIHVDVAHLFKEYSKDGMTSAASFMYVSSGSRSATQTKQIIALVNV